MLKLENFAVKINFIMQNTEVTPEIARQIFSNADSNGVTIEIYLQTLITNSQKTMPENEPPLSALLENLTGKVDSSRPSKKKVSSTAFGRALSEKFKRQGLKTP